MCCAIGARLFLSPFHHHRNCSNIRIACPKKEARIAPGLQVIKKSKLIAASTSG
jgi:hypothetical protein